MSKLTLRLESYAKDAEALVVAAQALADDRKHAEVEPLHLLHRMVEQQEDARDAIDAAGVDPNDVLVEAESQLRKLRKARDSASFLSPRMLDLLGRAEGEAARQGGVKVSMKHLLLGCAQEEKGPVKQVFKYCGLSAPVIRATLNGASVNDDGGSGSKKKSSSKGSSSDVANPLDEFGRDLTKQATQGVFDPAVGRDAELRRMLQVLARRRENNPLLVGEPGIGKNTIVEALAARIAKGDVPKMLVGRRIVALEVSAMIAGAKLRGQLEERMRSVLDAVRDSAGEIILYIPSLGDLMSNRSAQAAAGLLTGALGTGSVRCIACATPDGVRKAFDEDSALGRRFVGIEVEPPTLEEAVAVLRGVVGRYETDHGVRITDPSLVSAVTFARRYVPGVQLPKSAVDLIDEAAARVRVEMESVPAELDALQRRVEAAEIQYNSLLDDDDEESVRTRDKIKASLDELKPKLEARKSRWESELGSVSDVRRIKKELSAAQRELEQARANEDHARAGELRFGSIPMLEKQLEEAGNDASEDVATLVRDTVTPEDVADVVAAWTGVPVSKMMEEEAQKLLKMEDRLHERVIGQEEALTAVSKAVRRGRVGLRDPGRPIGSFLFLGPTGVGKTELAKALAEFLFDDEASLTRLDMSEFMEKHSVARLLGAPPGYVDSDQGGFLTEAVRQRPYSVVLFDEMEKAHPDVFNILLQVLDDGRLTDSRGRRAHFSDTVVIMTSNIGSHRILGHQGTREELREMVEEELHANFRPEFLNRIDDIVIFDALTKEDLMGIADILLRKLGKLLAHRRITLEVTDAAKTKIVELGYDPSFGARPLKRVILKQLQDPLAAELLRGGYKSGDKIKVDLDGDEFVFSKT